MVFAFIYGSFNDDSGNLPFLDIDIGVYITGMDKKASFYFSLDLSTRFTSLLKLPVDIRVVDLGHGQSLNLPWFYGNVLFHETHLFTCPGCMSNG